MKSRTVTALVVLVALSSCQATPRASRAARKPEGFASVSLTRADPDTDSAKAHEAAALGVEGGRFFHETEVGRLAWEAHLAYSKHDVEFTYLDPFFGPILIEEEPTNLKLGVGVRHVFDEVHPELEPYVRAGLLHQSFSDDLVDDAGVGFYLGLGVDYVVGPWGFGPHLLYSSTSLDDFDVDEVGVGVKATYRF